ncbi:hypothetical protein TNCV_1346341 [Trichonephila clavipes]|nr:hypothetical protein TNCV_1346341 [Trichonephila clavipes]
MRISQLRVRLTFYRTAIQFVGEIKLHRENDRKTARTHAPASDALVFLALSITNTNQRLPSIFDVLRIINIFFFFFFLSRVLCCDYHNSKAFRTMYSYVVYDLRDGRICRESL